ncbi:MAG: MurR/RpiR family transcriptional regulator [Eubacteriales bacterium]|nr:MurR/RpiR family transcriptional regulator [Eubacteriales bacterium]
MNIITKIKNEYNGYSKGQKLIADYVLNHYEQASYLTAASLGKTVGVSESTVVRFASELGFEGYPQLKRALQEVIKTKLTSVQRISMAETRIGNDEILTSVLNQDIDRIKYTLDHIDRNAFKESVDVINDAEDIYILGSRSSASLAGFMGFYLNLIRPNVHVIQSTSASEMFERLIRVNKKSVVIGISFPRYSLRTTNAIRFAKSKGAKVIAITDSLDSPMADHADYTLASSSDMTSFVDSLVAPLSVINSLLVAVSLKKKEDLINTFDELENIWTEYDVYEKETDENE